MPTLTTLAPALIKEQRRHPRVQLNLPVRLRWPTPLGQITEVTETLDVCRGGLLVHRRDLGRVGALLWVTFPFDSSLPVTQPETPARIVRLDQTPAGDPLLAIEFEPVTKRRDANAAGELDFRPARERRGSPRIPLALPIRVRPLDSPWPEETMTRDVSNGGVLFCTTRLYATGDPVHVALPMGSLVGRWASAAETPARIVRVSRLPGEVEQQVALAFPLAQKP